MGYIQHGMAQASSSTPHSTLVEHSKKEEQQPGAQQLRMAWLGWLRRGAAETRDGEASKLGSRGSRL